MRVSFHSGVRADVLEAISWYEARSPVAALAFVNSVDQAVSRIAIAPNQHPLAWEEFRKVNLTRFPYSVFYRVYSDHIEKIAVAHQRRREGYWSNRVED